MAVEIEADYDVFPNNIIQPIALALEASHAGFENQVYPRMLRPSDPNPCIGVFPSLWIPDQDSLEMGHRPSGEPTVQSYAIVVQAMNKDADKDIALARHATIARLIRRTLYRSEPLRLLLAALIVEDGTSKERFQRMTVGTQRFLTNEIGGQFVFLSVLDLSIDTETV